MENLNRLYAAGVIPVAVIENAADAVPAAQAIRRGGISVLEITFRTPAAEASLRAAAEACPDMLVGAGTVTSLAQCRKALEAGAGFIVSPGYDREIVHWCVDHNVAVAPGCVTPSEIMAAMELGLRVVKFFPANVYGGLAAMQSLAGPFGGIRFIPTGGVNGENLREYLAAPCVYAVGGSWLCRRDDITGGNFRRITALCAAASAAVKEVRGCGC